MTAPNFFSKRARREAVDATKVAPSQQTPVDPKTLDDDLQPRKPIEDKLQKLKEDVKQYQETKGPKRI